MCFVLFLLSLAVVCNSVPLPPRRLVYDGKTFQLILLDGEQDSPYQAVKSYSYSVGDDKRSGLKTVDAVSNPIEKDLLLSDNMDLLFVAGRTTVDEGSKKETALVYGERGVKQQLERRLEEDELDELQLLYRMEKSGQPGDSLGGVGELRMEPGVGSASGYSSDLYDLNDVADEPPHLEHIHNDEGDRSPQGRQLETPDEATYSPRQESNAPAEDELLGLMVDTEGMSGGGDIYTIILPEDTDKFRIVVKKDGGDQLNPAKIRLREDSKGGYTVY